MYGLKEVTITDVSLDINREETWKPLCCSWTVTLYPMMGPFLSCGSGGSHKSSMLVELTESAVIFCTVPEVTGMGMVE